MKILIAPDKFKGSLTAKQVCDVVQSALLACDPSFQIQCLPLADGGEGTGALLTDFTGGDEVDVIVHDPLFRMINSGYGISKDGKTAFIEMARASGLQLLKREERNPLYTTTLGTGDLIVDALDRGVDTIIIGIGGSATNDAGVGIGEALGLEFFASMGVRLKPIGKSLQAIERVDFSKAHARGSKVACFILCDVDNPLYGPRGAAFVYGPQKGADENAVVVLDNGLKHFGTLFHDAYHADIDFPGAGAAGGVSIMLKALMKAEVKPGFEFISDFMDLEKSIAATDVVITGEGKMDEQTLSGKVVQGIARHCKKYNKPLIAVTGKCDLRTAELDALGIEHVIQLIGQDTSQQDAIENASEILKMRVKKQLFSLLNLPKK